MEVSEQQRIMRSSKISRLPGPKSSQESGGLVEMTESQNNSRIQYTGPTYGKSSIQGVKRETPQPGNDVPPSPKKASNGMARTVTNPIIS
ncbi:unnamed protein product [Clonostachys byssicola]|uniref:Uncharacterized protein n=1 Tax=Clonostachys byssicola TaxID=160290 RepID=A0A9N9Y3N7_9HYPO|nr:unnamed protein product [Clonostachys byssicola]